ncbi:MAG TPA: choice-of-anchor tandem repeat GloVer-containing protein, partial [Bacteroidia bacterium]|nr:choice-of-anchor tandem repeat GloVer-containing protein [Bacteroidia bacterium]
SSLMQASNGLLYGLENESLFSFDPKTNNLNVVYTFAGGVFGQSPGGKPLQAKDGYLYGMTTIGGVADNGVIYRFDPVSGKDTTLLEFNSKDGSQPEGYFMQDTISGLLYAMTEQGGIGTSSSDGVLFSFDPKTYKDSVIKSFVPKSGNRPEGSVMQAKNRIIYGMCGSGGKYNDGTLFSYDPISGKESLLLNFNDTNGAVPFYGVMLEASNGLLYGMTPNGGKLNGGYGDGVIFAYNTSTGKDSVIYEFDSIHGAQPYGSLIEDTANGLFYGLTELGGAHNAGVIFSFDPKTGKDSVLVDFVMGGPLGELLLLRINPPAGINELSANKVSLQIFPNPFYTSTTIVFAETGKHYLEVDDITGRQLEAIECTGKQYELQRNNLAPGIYFIKAFDQEHNYVATSKIVIE